MGLLSRIKKKEQAGPRDYYVTTKLENVDYAFLTKHFGERSSWLSDHSRQQIERATLNAECYALMTPEGATIGFARLLTDFVRLAFLLDLFVVHEDPDKQAELEARLLASMLKDELFPEGMVWLVADPGREALWQSFEFEPAAPQGTTLYRRVHQRMTDAT